jgi:hypothetical protein
LLWIHTCFSFQFWLLDSPHSFPNLAQPAANHRPRTLDYSQIAIQGSTKGIWSELIKLVRKISAISDTLQLIL